MSEIQIDPSSNLQNGGLKDSSESKSEVNGSSIIESITEYNFSNFNVKDFLKEYKYEILLGLIILGAIVFKLWNNPYLIKQYFKNPFHKNLFHKIDLHKTYESKKIPKIIWLYWNDPIDKAPWIVRMCVSLIHKFNKDFSVRLLNEENYKEFVPDKEVISVMESKLNHNYKSDLLRLYLIYEYGGIYIDATVLPFQSFEWIIKLMNESDKEILLYKNTRHTTDKDRPVCESWFIVSDKKNHIIKILFENFKNALKEGPENSYRRLLSDKSVNYQNFIGHGPYHLIYYVIIHTLTTNNLHDKIEYLDCSYPNFPCIALYGNNRINELFLNKHNPEEFTQFCYDNKFCKFTNYNRQYIEEKNLRPIEGSVMDQLMKIQGNNKRNIVKLNQHYYINLDYRTDRRERAIQEFQKIGIQNPNRFSAIKNDIHGGIGCGLSHVAVLEKAKQNGWDYVIIMEDDIKFYDPEETMQKINNIFQSDIEWDVMIIGSIIEGPIEPINEDCVRALGGIRATIMYIVKSHYYDTLINLWKKDMISFENDIIRNQKNMNKNLINKIYGKYAIDQTWKKLQKKDKFITVIPNKVYEHGGNSDIWSTHNKYIK